jgi:hypothetical protein
MKGGIEVNNGPKTGRVFRRYRRNLPMEDFDKWSDVIGRSARGCGLYALYRNGELIYVGLATKSIRSRIHAHRVDGKIPFTHFSVFLVTGKSGLAQARRIRDLEAFLLKVILPRPKWNKCQTRFISAKKLQTTRPGHFAE